MVSQENSSPDLTSSPEVKPDEQMQVYVISFNGFGTSSRDTIFSKGERSPTGMRQLDEYLERRFAEHPQAVVHTQNFDYDEVSEAVEYLQSAEKVDKLIVVGHSYGGRATYEFAQQLSADQKIDLQISVDAVGWGNPETPNNVEQTVNFYQREYWWDKGYSIPWGVDRNVTGAENINVEQKYNQELGHLTIDDFEPLHQEIGNLIDKKVKEEPTLEPKVLQQPNLETNLEANLDAENNLDF